jgi:hypothetical protein
MLLRLLMTACGTSRTSRDVRLESAKRAKADIGQVTFTNRFYEYRPYPPLHAVRRPGRREPLRPRRPLASAKLIGVARNVADVERAVARPRKQTGMRRSILPAPQVGAAGRPITEIAPLARAPPA